MPSKEQIRKALISAAKRGRLKKIQDLQDLLDQGVDVFARNEDLLKAGVDLNKADILFGWTELHYAAFYGYVDEVCVLLEAGADVNLPNRSGDTALHIAARKGGVEVVSLLLQTGADVNLLNQYSGQTALHIAVENGHVEVVSVLLEAGADVNLLNKYGETALHIAARNGDVGMCRLLLEASADVNLLNKYGETALHIAARNGDVGVCRLLLEAGADVNLRNRSGETVLHIASQKGYVNIVRLFLNKDADVSLLDKNDQTALHYAEKIGHVYVVRLLCMYSADVYWGRKFGLFSPRPVGFFAKLSHFIILGVQKLASWFLVFFRQPPPISGPVTWPIRRAAIDYLREQGNTFSSEAELYKAINQVLRQHVHSDQDDSWQVEGNLARYWEEYKMERGADLKLNQAMWELKKEGALDSGVRPLGKHEGEISPGTTPLYDRQVVPTEPCESKEESSLEESSFFQARCNGFVKK